MSEDLRLVADVARELGVHKTTGYCWRTYFHVTGLRLLLWIPMFLSRQ